MKRTQYTSSFIILPIIILRLSSRLFQLELRSDEKLLQMFDTVCSTQHNRIQSLWIYCQCRNYDYYDKKTRGDFFCKFIKIKTLQFKCGINCKNLWLPLIPLSTIGDRVHLNGSRSIITQCSRLVIGKLACCHTTICGWEIKIHWLNWTCVHKRPIHYRRRPCCQPPEQDIFTVQR